MNLTTDRYTDLVTHLYKDSDRFKSLLAATLQPLEDIGACLSALDLAMDLDLAVGVQLDAIGEMVGAKRVVDFQPSNSVSPVLDDDTFRLLIRAKVAQNNWDGKIQSLYDVWQQLFPGGNILVADNQNMTLTVTLYGAFSSIIEDLIVNGLIVPRPEGVLIDYVYGTQPYFGYDKNDAYIAGYETGHWAG